MINALNVMLQIIGMKNLIEIIKDSAYAKTDIMMIIQTICA